MTMSLSEEQAAFVHAAPGVHQSLQSWAGTGKTHTLTERVVRLLSLGTPPESIVITTFTVEGTRECVTRLNGRMGCECGVRIGTMDSLASQWMRQYFQPADYYTGVQEYGTLLLEYLRSPAGVNIKERVKYLIVDEFQDLSRTQLDTVMEFYGAGSIIMAIGDVAQNIYEWRGCHGHFLSSLPQRIPQMQEFHLTLNRRCTPEIIATGNACLRFLRQPPDRLMRHVRPSMGLKPIMDVMEPGRNLGAHVLRVMRRYRATMSYGDMAVLGRYKQGLFNVEESLIKVNRFAPCADAVVPFMNSATVGDVDRSPRRKDGFLTMMTLHQSKGLEWPLVILLLWDPALLDEEWRLLYVAVTRARDRLHIIAPNAKTAAACIKRMGDASLFVLPDGAPLEGDATLLTATTRREREPVTGIIDVIRRLTCTQIQELRKKSLIPMSRGTVKASPGCKIFRYNPRQAEFEAAASGEVEPVPEDEVDANGLQIEFGNFVDRYLTRLFWVQLNSTQLGSSGPLVDRDALSILETVFLSRDQWDVCAKYVDFVSAQDGACRVTLLHKLADAGSDREEIQALSDALDKIAMHCRHSGTDRADVRLAVGRPHMQYHELNRLRVAYDKFKDPKNQKAVFHTYRISLCSVIIKGRKSMWYHPEAYLWFRRKLAWMLPCIRRYVADTEARSTSILLKPVFQFQALSGEANLMTDTSCVDFKCSKRTQDFAWLAQGLAYMAMESVQSNRNLGTLQIFNPIMQTIWEYDCRDWAPGVRAAFLEYLTTLTTTSDHP
ncbi:hypothetical protein TSOC_005122 [Tetrabaena socialis]|uniref:Uncharacterized protein n=1 Tax=Tetrabaena socialis TaxID=47790 RepID=A0A2J8A781_9CHLO|nr:hypothetical protein TSOC_005122 [Tetrabaena socialis]|eukprot:PNH08350.1 hypothetical protein TSOC_005122 [Tetrabaena socialis]